MDTKEYRDSLYRDIWYDRIPDRVPISQLFDMIYALQFAGMSLTREQYNLDKLYEAVDHLAAEVDNDLYPMSSSKNITSFRISGNLGWVMGSDGFLQHPNVAPMTEDEYPKLIEDPLKLQAETNIRLNTALQCSPEERALVQLRIDASNARYYRKTAQKKKEICEKYQKSTFEHQIGLAGGPFDSLANGYRSFSGSLLDIRRRPDEVLQAVEKLTQNSLKTIDRFPSGEEGGFIFMPLHMATFMKQKDFEKFWWPFFQRVIEKCHTTDRRMWLFCEHNWDRYLDFLTETPKGTMIAFEKTDAKLAKEKLGKGRILSGFFPVAMYRGGTVEECQDAAKKLLDIVAPGGGYTFKSDCNPITFGDAKLENVKAVFKTVKEYGKY